MKALSCIFLLLALVMTAAAADVTGKWTGTITVPEADGQAGQHDGAYVVLKQSGATITGSGGPSESDQWPISDGKIVEDKITGSVTNPDGVVYKLALTVNGDRITGEVTMTQEGQSVKAKLDLTRAK